MLVCWQLQQNFNHLWGSFLNIKKSLRKTLWHTHTLKLEFKCSSRSFDVLNILKLENPIFYGWSDHSKLEYVSYPVQPSWWAETTLKLLSLHTFWGIRIPPAWWTPHRLPGQSDLCFASAGNRRTHNLWCNSRKKWLSNKRTDRYGCLRNKSLWEAALSSECWDHWGGSMMTSDRWMISSSYWLSALPPVCLKRDVTFFRMISM